MTLQMTMVFGALLAQMAVISFLLVPLPFMIRSKIVNGWAALRQNANYKVGLIFVSGIMVLQFVDYSTGARILSLLLGHTWALDFCQISWRRKFYAQRNLYLSGAVIYLGLSIHTVLAIMGKLVAKEALYRDSQNEGETNTEEIAKLKEAIRKREVEITAMRKQIEGVQKAYDALTDSAERSKDD
ncbi:hypothetical protein HF325_000078 [Metschnikowia pulcherrima]|uniref:Endoplasmic reticulum transmembrane protein n=1 Tax=Metschnikowia pulcherrima TaxID=27326 RepID=A0A8H7GXW6_9ASCO|nr:hypothetical protein HF325_000078 [Metschnikowia pulcherrima]